MDGFHEPTAKKASPKAAAEAVVMHVSHAGNAVLSLLSGLLAAALILYSGFVLYDTFYTQASAARTPYELLQLKPEIIDDGIAPLSGQDRFAAINEDYRAWLTLYETNIDYAVMQGEDNLFYASHDVYGEVSLTGSIYLASENTENFSDSYNLIYGHHMDNGAMFGGLDEYRSEAYLNAHREGMLVTGSGIYDLTIFAVAETDAYEGRIYSVGDRMNEILDHLRTSLETGEGKTRVLSFDEGLLEGKEKIAAFSTCAGAETNGRLVVFAVMSERVSGYPSADPESPADPADPGSPEGQKTPADPTVPSGSETQDPPETPVDAADPAEEEPVIEEIEDTESPLAAFVKNFTPKAGPGTQVWALVNLICMLVTVYLFLPILQLKSKYGRIRMMKDYNEKDDSERFGIRRYQRRFGAGFGLELVIAVLAVVAFILTENMKLPMALIDRWSPLMILLLVMCWIIDVRLLRRRGPEEEEEMKEELKEEKA